jgi:hypothetical protein
MAAYALSLGVGLALHEAGVEIAIAGALWLVSLVSMGGMALSAISCLVIQIVSAIRQREQAHHGR